MQNYDMLIDRIAASAGLERVEVERRVEAKKAKLSGLISKEGAAQIIAAELGISFENQDLKVNELMPGMRKVNVVGKIINMFPVREFSKNDREGKVANFILADDTGSVRVVLWDLNHIGKIEDGSIKQGDSVEIKNASSRDGEIHLSGFSDIKKVGTVFEEVKSEAVASEAELKDVRQGQTVKIRGAVVQVFQPRFYSVCPNCNKKVSGDGVCAEHGKVSAKERAILNFVLDDGTETMRVVLFSDQIGQVIDEGDLKDEAKALAFRDDFLGSEVFVTGQIRKNQMFENLEIIGSHVEKVDVEKLIEVLSGGGG